VVYQYRCDPCANVFDVVKRAAAMTDPEFCSQCGKEAVREFVPSRVYFNGTSVQHAEFNPGLGCVTRNSNDRKEIAKRKGVEEIGNEPTDKIHKHFDQAREDNRERAWAELDKGWQGNGDVGA
jgi:predicted nucleic acid-binding Zn ribbon protein